MNTPKDKKWLLKKLEEDVRRIAKSINDTRGICPSGKIAEAREYLNSVLKLNLERSITERMRRLHCALRKAMTALNETRRDFHSKHLKSVREDISDILKKYESQIN
ncbi:MAG: hypothetical protein UT30_C0021G0002 [Candidatus Uhrbacteria bacterium GW2011_GWF2_39_13]|uniref:Uncharacterized protein n=1 Tax=Candidatus Uhrbacteria bacterium GW2011_GWF2_39_13 TaxID=1618995 RepID=A0A0G0MKP6_9BACT|nr:MAG: hypothetical protein UT30_C0021G0002 [Candidatus Uhrbacteria bacterium GW2011_GWF2_39_13]